MLNLNKVFKNKIFLVAFLIIAFLVVGGLVIFNKTKAQLDCSSYDNQLDCLDAGCDWDAKTYTCKEPTTPTPTPIPTCQPSQENYSNEGANWSYRSDCYNASSNVSTYNLDKQFIPPSSYVHLYPSSLPSMTLSECPDSKMKTQACFVPTPNNGSFVPYFVKQGA